jgi:hypothetical protein
MAMIKRPLAGIAFASAAFCAIALSSTANADPHVVNVGQSYMNTPISFTLGESTFTFSGTGDWFNPTAVETAGTGEFNTIFGQPTSYFVDRGTVTFGPGDQFAAFSSPTTISYSNGNNFIGLRATDGANVYYGFAYTTDNILNSYGFETTPGATITATVAGASAGAVPEPASWAMMLGGFGVIGGAMRARRRSVAFA